ncbi:MAG: TetR/AcrR family transcriptional regulator [Thermoanaerobaculia bacterium]|nr:TetR/AcrR family transcriptional regulator [Thermoanaerobaculia bacterium]
MSNKENILHVAMRLFAEQGYDRTPTSQIAREANVSEGLIFRHYGNKAGLLEAIIRTGAGQVNESMQVYERGGHPREAIALHIRESFRILREQTGFWRLVHQMRHQPAVQQSAEAQIGAFQRAVAERLAAQFHLLGAAQPELEALLLFALIDGITLQYLQMPDTYPLDALRDFLIQKFQHGNFMDQP